MERSTLGCFVALALVAACSEAKAPVGRTPSQAAVVATTSSLPEARDPLPLAQRLMLEASEHPEARQNVDRFLKSLQDAGIKMTRTHQALARPLSARYCATALTAAGLGLSMCAFADESAAQQGRALSQRSFDALIPGRTLLVDKANLLTITDPPSEEARGEAERIRARFVQSQGTEHAAL